MPLLVHAVFAWLLGLYAASMWAGNASTHIMRFALVAVIALGVCACVGALRKTQTVTLCCAVSLTAFVVGVNHATRKAACIAALSKAGSPIELAIDSRAIPGAFVRGEARGLGALIACKLNATIKVKAGDAPPGAITSFEGERTATSRGLHLEGEVHGGPRRALLRAWRGHAGEALDTLFGPRAALARALLIADQDGIDPAVRDRFANAGLIHILSISGLHVALIAGALTVIASALRLPRHIGAFASLFLVVLYVLALGAPPPAVRSAVMLATGTLIARLQRPVHPWTALALGAVIPTWRPDVVIDLGWQLSVSGMASLVAARALMRRMRNSHPARATRRAPRLVRSWRKVQRTIVHWFQRLDGWRWALVRELFTGTIASLVTAPIGAWYFGRVSVIAPISNIAASPVIAFLQPALFLAMVLAPWPTVAKVAADACTIPLWLLDYIAARAGDVPYAALRVAPTLLGAVCLGVATAAFVRATASRWPARIVLVGIAAACVAVWGPMIARGSGELELHMIDVGQGDAIALRTPHGHWVLIDAGRSWKGGDAGRRTVVPYVRRRGGDVAALILSHPHDDHVGGAASVLVALHPARWWEPAYVGTSPTYRQALLQVQKDRIPWHRAHPGDSLVIDGVLFRALAPDSMWTSVQSDPNLASVVMAVEFGSVRWLFTGDAETEEEEWLIGRWGSALQSSVLKVGHHGSKTSSSPTFLDAVNPAVALVSVGADNTYGHPSPLVMQEFAKRGIRVVRTDQEGSVVVRTNGKDEVMETSRGKWNVPRRE